MLSTLDPRCRVHLLCARYRCDLLAGWRLNGLSPGVVQLIVQVLARFSELIHALSQTPREVRQFFRSEEDEHDEEDDK